MILFAQIIMGDREKISAALFCIKREKTILKQSSLQH